MNTSEMQSFYCEFPNYQEEFKSPQIDKDFVRSLVNSGILNRLKEQGTKEYLIYLETIVAQDFKDLTRDFVD